MIERLEIIKKRYDEINAELLNPDVLQDYAKQKKLNQEKSTLEEAALKFEEYLRITNETAGLKELLGEPEMVEIVKAELEHNEAQLEQITKELEIMLIPKDEHDGKDIIMEIRGAAGGDEANIFAGDLFRMYSRYADKNNWKIEVNHEIGGTSGGYSTVEFSITGKNVYSKLKFESGTHRVQRVPETETQGRVHTSTATVLVIPEVEDVDVELKTEDIRVDVYRSSGKGGQGVNTTDSAVRLTHIPTGIVVTCQNERSQIKNKEIAMKILVGKLEQLNEEKHNNELNSLKGNQNIDFGSQIRNYTLEPYRLVKDVRSGYETSDTDGVLDGEIFPFMKEYLRVVDQNEKNN